MYLQKTYQNICGHTGIGPITLHTHQIRDASSTHSYHTTTCHKASLQLPMPCVFCSGILQQMDVASQSGYQTSETNQSNVTSLSSQSSLAETPPGSGLLCILLPHQPYQASPNPYQPQATYWYWYPLKSLPLEVLTPTDWQPPFVPASHPSLPPLYTYDMVWIPRPCGEVRITQAFPLIPEQENQSLSTQQTLDLGGGREDGRGAGGMVMGSETDGSGEGRGIERDIVTEVSSSRKEKMTLSEAMSGRGMGQGSRMVGLISQLRAAVRSGEMAGRYT